MTASPRSLKAGARALLGTALSLAVSGAFAIGFDDVDPTIFGNGDTFVSDGYTATVFGPTSDPGLLGAILRPGQSACAAIQCPAADFGNYYTALNDGGISFASATAANQPFVISSFDAAFVPAEPVFAPDPVARVVIDGRLAGSSTYVSATFDLAGTDLNGDFNFATYSLAGTALSNAWLSSVSLHACLIESSGACSWPADNQAQFALDNIAVAAVPEAQTWALLGVGLLTLGLSGRRRAVDSKRA